MHPKPWAVATAICLALVGAGCTQPGVSGGSGVNQSPPTVCPHRGPDTVVVAGDSIAGMWTQHLSFPDGTVTVNNARGGAGFT